MSEYNFEIINLKKIDYEIAHKKQLEYNYDVHLGITSPKIIICSHNPVVTLGKRIEKSSLNLGWKGKIINVERGGQATYHGPSQVILYPIFPLNKFKISIEKYLVALEESMIDTLKIYNVEGFGNNDRGNPKYTGVWVNDSIGNRKKIASIGIALKRWVTYHGLALNLYKDAQAFQGINPCGFTSDTMTSLEVILNRKVERQEFENYLTETLIKKIRNSL